jgi:DNA-binding transcriptional LysR family regulator
MNIETLDLNLLRVFDAVYRDRSLSRAATRLGLSQPGVSQALNRLRQHASDPLFVRQSHGVTPTAYSDALAGPVRRTLESLQSALQTQASKDIRLAERRLQLAMSDYSESLILAPLMHILDEQAPLLRIRTRPVDGDELHNALQQGSIDLAVGALPSLNEHYRNQLLFTEEFVCIARRGHPEIAEELTLEAYAAARHVGLAARTVQGAKIDQACLALGFQRQVFATVPNFLSMPFVVAATDSIATVPRRMLRLIPNHVGLQVLTPPLVLTPANIRQYWPERLHHDAVCVWLREQILAIGQTL